MLYLLPRFPTPHPPPPSMREILGAYEKAKGRSDRNILTLNLNVKSAGQVHMALPSAVITSVERHLAVTPDLCRSKLAQMSPLTHHEDDENLATIIHNHVGDEDHDNDHGPLHHDVHHEHRDD
ncbi:hypothetical protein SCLCIDRAFT_27005 [Scleroderma citrinum Foug A]|uniref:Uncharacterized protein n=1 Tax=Scleroderma citrinum Foug A TaxID=1036808 RepID=A0A0C3A5D9_9AGAM|nr:hypothetical protein SCLCIDRAFT_27005 [Scleroderma citrinum Foug A]